MKHAVIYHPGKTQIKYTGPSAESVEVYAPDIGIKISNFWRLNAYKEIDVWYAYITDEEAKALLELKDIKVWIGDTEKEAWKLAYESGVKDLTAVVEQSCKAVVKVDGKDKLLTVEEAKKIAPEIKPNFDATDDSVLPIKVLTLWS